MWDKIKLKSVTPYRSNPRLKAKDRVKVLLDMPIETYSDFRRQVEAPNSFGSRRSGDPTPSESIDISTDKVRIYPVPLGETDKESA